MIKQAGQKDMETLKRFLYREPVYHTFLIADIEIYGFEQEFQKVYMQMEEGCCQGVFLRYYNNFLIAGDEQEIDYPGLISLLDASVTTIMGRAQIIAELNDRLEHKQKYNINTMYTLPVTERSEQTEGTQIATLSDVDEIYELLMSTPEIKNLYAEKKMITNRITKKEGIHVIIRKGGRIIAHGNSAASTKDTAMIGGLCVVPEYRKQGYAKQIIRRIGKELHTKHKLPCVFTQEALGKAIFEKVKFVKFGEWGVMEYHG